jgi:hypothetical protein
VKSLSQQSSEYRRWWESNTDVPYGECWCGCGRKTHIAPYNDTTHGYVRDEPRPYLKGHNRRNIERTDLYRTYIVRNTGYDTDCWLWPVVSAEHGYVQITRDGKRQMAHRYYYEQRYGPIPEVLQLDHLCRVRHCVNPDHLEAVTATTNLRRGLGPKLTLEKAQEIRRLYATGEYTKRALARLFGVTDMIIVRIIRNEIWRSHVR